MEDIGVEAYQWAKFHALALTFTVFAQCTFVTERRTDGHRSHSNRRKGDSKITYLTLSEMVETIINVQNWLTRATIHRASAWV